MVDVYDMWKSHDAEREREQEKLPKCCYCGARITDDYFYFIDEEVVCEKCLNTNFRKPIEDFIEEE